MYKGFTLVFDVDGTLCPVKQAGERYEDLKPYPAMLEKLRRCHAGGAKIVLSTSRNMKSYGGNLGLINKHTAKTLLDWLEKWQIPYDEIYYGKPWPGEKGFYIDDRSVRPDEFLRLPLEELEKICENSQGGGEFAGGASGRLKAVGGNGTAAGKCRHEGEMESEKYLERSRCVITGGSDLEELYVFKNFPVHMGTTEEPPEKDVRKDLVFDICLSSGVIQVRSLVEEKVLYNAPHSRSIGGVWRRHHEAFAAFIKAFSPREVLEIGGGGGHLDAAFNRGTETPVPWTILDPNPFPVEECRAKFERGFFDERYGLPAKEGLAVVTSHVFEHVYRPREFMEHLGKGLRTGGRIFFSVPNLRKMLEEKHTNALNFEHTYFLTEAYMDYLLGRSGFAVLRKEYFGGHSVFYAAERSDAAPPAQLDGGLYAENKGLFQDYLAEHEAFVRRANDVLKECPGRAAYLFGAHIFSQVLLAFGLDESRIKGLLDNDAEKQGKRLPGSRLRCFPPSVLAGEDEPLVILRAGAYQEEIKRDILENINPTAFILE